jgi:hypothetical protein
MDTLPEVMGNFGSLHGGELKWLLFAQSESTIDGAFLGSVLICFVSSLETSSFAEDDCSLHHIDCLPSVFLHGKFGELLFFCTKRSGCPYTEIGHP